MDKHLQNAKQPKNHKYMLSKPFKTPFSEKENWRVDSQLLVVGTTHAYYSNCPFIETKYIMLKHNVIVWCWNDFNPKIGDKKTWRPEADAEMS